MGNDLGLRPETLNELIENTAQLKARQSHSTVVLDMDGQTTQISGNGNE
jgi:hypothetical protein